MKDTDGKLAEALKRLEKCSEKIVQTRGYTHEAKSLRLLEELIREQLIHAHTRPATRTLR